MNLDLKSQVAIVTGAGRGIGRAIARRLAGAGARVVLAARSADQLDAVAAEIRAAGGAAVPKRVDVREEPDVVALFAAIREEFGRLDVLVNNAGIGRYGELAEFSAADFDAVMATNLRGTFLCCREAMRIMKPAGRGAIINISSVVGIKGYPNQAAYTASKHGIVGLTRSLAVEAQPHGIRVSVIMPGGVDTAMVGDARPDLNRGELLQPDDVADAVEYLLSLSGRAAVDELYIRRSAGAGPRKPAGS